MQRLLLACALGGGAGAQAAQEYAEQPGGMLQPFIYDEPPAPPPPAQGIYFSGFFTDHAVLQRGPAKAAVYGAVGGSASSVSLTVTEEGAPAYDIDAQIVDRAAGNLTW
eukprot:SAG31_NODE_2726_length_5182_cov_1.523903_3_plen_109_part_00